jgi:hypothetical protein
LSAFHPVNVTLDPPPPADPPAVAVLHALARPIGQKPAAWTVVRSAFWAALTFGLWPLLTWLGGFRAYATAEQQQYLHLARWLRQNSAHPLARRLESDADELAPRSWLWFVPVVALLGGVAAFAALFQDAHVPLRFKPWTHALLAGTYGHERVDPDWPFAYRHLADRLYAVWCVGVGVAYLAHFLQLHLHALDVRSFVNRFSQIAQAEGVHPVRADSLGLGLRPLWVAAGIALMMAGAPWGVLAMLAGGAQRRYITAVSRNTRAEVARRLRAMIVRRAPNVADGAPSNAATTTAIPPVPVYLRERCVEPLCRAEIPRGVNFCPRCGTRQRAKIDRVA